MAAAGGGAAGAMDATINTGDGAKAAAHLLVPFINGAYGSLEYLEDIGFKTYRDVFGDYIVKDDFRKTNENIIEILKDLHPYIKDKVDYITSCALHNWNRLLQMTIEQRLQSIEAKLWN
mgnify:CR=1 FL=1